MIHSIPALGGLILLGIGGLFLLGGAGLILYSTRLKRLALARRVDMVRQPADATAKLAAPPPISMRVTSGAADTVVLVQAARSVARFGIAQENVAKVLIAGQLGMVGLLGGGAYVAGGFNTELAANPMLRLLAATMAGGFAYFLPSMILRKQIRSRRDDVVAGLPDALELLVISVEAGLSFEDGIDRVTEALHSSRPALAEELALTSADLKILPDRDTALFNLANRIDAPSVRSVATTLSQTIRYGTPLAHALRLVSAELRSESLVQLEERANQLPTLMTIPMMIFIMPTIVMIVGGPAILRLLDSFSQ